MFFETLFQDGVFEFARCGRLPRNHNVTSRTSRIEVAFKTDNLQEHKGFWLQIEGIKRNFKMFSITHQYQKLLLLLGLFSAT